MLSFDKSRNGGAENLQSAIATIRKLSNGHQYQLARRAADTLLSFAEKDVVSTSAQNPPANSCEVDWNDTDMLPIDWDAALQDVGESFFGNLLPV